MRLAAVNCCTYERDAESGNNYAIFRSYVNRLGRFSSPDPIAGPRTRFSCVGVEGPPLQIRLARRTPLTTS